MSKPTQTKTASSVPETPTEVRKLDSAVKSLLAITANQKRDLAAGKAQFESLKANAAKLAEALRVAQAWLIACSDKDYTYARQAIAIKASEALAAYEEVQS